MAKAREIPGIGSEVAASEGARLVLRTRLEEFFSFREAALDWSDPEGVHDMRVASRRLRSAVADFRDYLPKSQLKKLRRPVKELADALGEVRDADVGLAVLAEVARESPPELSAGLESFFESARARRETARARLSDALDAGKLESLREELLALLAPLPVEHEAAPDGDASGPGAGEPEAEHAAASKSSAEPPEDSARPEDSTHPEADAPTDNSSPDNSPPTFGEAGREVVEDRLREFAEQSTSLFCPHDSDALHDLRIEAKSLRYALELFSICLGESLKHYAKEIARLQSALGQLHDCDIWIEELGRRLKPKGEKGATARLLDSLAPPTPERRAALWLLRYFSNERERHYEEALARWHAWENHRLLAHIRATLSAPAQE